MNVSLKSQMVLLLLCTISFFSLLQPIVVGQNRAGVYRGYNANPRQFPFQLSLRQDGRHICGAIITDARSALSAAHCFSQSKEPSSFTVVAGTLHLKNLDTTAQTLQVLAIDIHPEYNANTEENDIAYITLERMTLDKSYVNYVALPGPLLPDLSTTTCLVIGWGRTDVGTDLSDQLQWTKLKFVTHEECSRRYKAKYDFTITDLMLCAEDKDRKSDTCPGDSGGPLVIEIDQDPHFLLLGVTSLGELSDTRLDDCGSSTLPGVYTRVNLFASWIQQVRGGQPLPPPPDTISTTSAPTPTPSPARDFAQLAVSLHNDCRRRHGAGPLTLDFGITQQAQEYADEVIQRNYALNPKPGAPFGQNLFANIGQSISPLEAVRTAVDKWCNGISSYNWLYPLSSSSAGFLFSQVVWRASQKIGIGVASNGGRTVVIAFYSPQGNIRDLNSYRENV